ncbi:hypothetical protein [Acetobacter malorum]|uniref:hypothetical protein n=1 Tax=Acetobacter malorum TaxID=178901 RepID=UPI0012E868C7|nr:hypothetical protein [Acetobacter malorum]
MSRIAIATCQQCGAKATVITTKSTGRFEHRINYDSKAGLICSIWQKNHPEENTEGTGNQCRFLRDAKNEAIRENTGQ